MNAISSTSYDTGLEVIDSRTERAFAASPVGIRDAVAYMEGVQRIARAFVTNPETVLRELVNVAVELCAADSAGISIEREDRTENEFYRWVATAGQYSGFLNAILPHRPSACTICLERGHPQRFRVSKPFFDLLGIEAPLVTDGILLPWQVDNTRGTIFVMAHGRTDAFDEGDCRVMELLAEFAAMGVRQQQQQKLLIEQASAAAAAAMANDLAHQINNPLQSLTNILYLAAEGVNGDEAKTVGEQSLNELQRLSSLVQKLLALQR
jgi:two-component sensor histidine kinase